MVDYRPAFRWVCEREKIRIAKVFVAPPWTEDEILRTYRFCNVRREDDTGTVWIRENIREPYAGHPNLWFMLCIARQINWPETLQELISEGAWPDRDDRSVCADIAAVLDARKAAGRKVYTGAYMISAPHEKGANKQRYIALDVLGGLWQRRRRYEFQLATSMQQTHAWIMQARGWGHFMAYQAVVDMRFTAILNDARDVSTWAAAGPGTLRGLNRLHGRELTAIVSQEQALKEMRLMYEVMETETGVAMDFSDVPNILCETDKYFRVKNGEGKPRALYVPGRGS